MRMLLLHLSDAHFKSKNDALYTRASNISSIVKNEIIDDQSCCVIAFTGDIVDKGANEGFAAGMSFLIEIQDSIGKINNTKPVVLIIPGNHDIVRSDNQDVRDALISSLTPENTINRPKPTIEKEIFRSFDRYFELVQLIPNAVSVTNDKPYYFSHDIKLGDASIRFHLLNTAWMCKSGVEIGDLLYPIKEINPPHSKTPPIYEISLLHHPFSWFKQPEVMRPLRDRLEDISDMLITGHEHSSRSVSSRVNGELSIEYREGGALQDTGNSFRSGFSLFTLDFDRGTQYLSTYTWLENSYVRESGPIELSNSSSKKANFGFKISGDFFAKIDDPELPVVHPKHGRLKLSELYVYPDIKKIDNDEGGSQRRLPGQSISSLIAEETKILLLGSDRSGKSSLAKRLFSDLFKHGYLPVLVNGRAIARSPISKIHQFIEKSVKEQYVGQPPEVFAQIDHSKKVIVLDDFHLATASGENRTDLLVAIEERFGAIVLIGTDEFYYEEMMPIEESERKTNKLWLYSHYRILPFGYLKREEFVKKWIQFDKILDQNELSEKASNINGILTRFLRTNPIPQYPWVIVIIVQAADSPDPLHAENGSYGFLLEALITAALARSRSKHPINGRYRWLAEIANELFKKNRSTLSELEAKQVHDTYCAEYAVTNLDFYETCDDLIAAGVLRRDGADVSFRQPYTYCYFVAWHLARRVDSGDSDVREEIKELWKDLYHEDTANVLVFLAHLTTSPVVLEEMIARASKLFSAFNEADFVNDVQHINALCARSHQLVLPPGLPSENARLDFDERDEQKAVQDAIIAPKKNVILKPSKDAMDNDSRPLTVMDIVTALRAIEILGQVLRNEATARKASSLINITEQVFKLGRRIIGFILKSADEQMPAMTASLEKHYRGKMPKAKSNDVIDEANIHLYSMYTFAAFTIIKSVALAVSDRNLREVFRQLVAGDSCLPNRLYNFVINLEIAFGESVIEDAKDLNNEIEGKAKPKGHIKGQPRLYNNFAHTILQTLAIDYLYLNQVSRSQVQSLCSNLGIDQPPSSINDPSQKKLPPKK